MTKPIIKWVGGKTQLLDTIIPLFPKIINEYHEIFLGGASVLLHILDLLEEKKASFEISTFYAYDLNKPLIEMYNNIKSNPNQIVNEINKIAEKYFDIETFKGNKKPSSELESIQSRESYYYWIRKCYNNLTDDEKCSPYGSSIFIFLNRTCFRGLHRIGPNGFNVPYGNYKNPHIIDREHVLKIHILFNKYNVVFRVMDFISSLKLANKHLMNFAYLDPPYFPEDGVKSFTKYNDMEFSKDTHDDLFNAIKNMNINLVMSNSNSQYILSTFSDYDVRLINARRRINSKNPENTTTESIIVKKIEK